jgi:hypothetical protein
MRLTNLRDVGQFANLLVVMLSDTHSRFKRPFHKERQDLLFSNSIFKVKY